MRSQRVTVACRGPSAQRCRWAELPTSHAWEDRAVDSRALSLLLSPEGWTLLNQLPPYEEKTALKLAEGLRGCVGEGLIDVVAGHCIEEGVGGACLRGGAGPVQDHARLGCAVVGVSPEVPAGGRQGRVCRSEEHTSELQSRGHLVCRLLLEK